MTVSTTRHPAQHQPVWTSKLLDWYAKNRRDLPWRPPPGNPGPVDPYAVLISEFMLQQTQVATVLPYFDRFMIAFPTLAALAAASEHDVLRLWQGLGYYSRARNLHLTAKMIVAEFGGRVPAAVGDLITLPGIGRYTAGAIASIAFGCRAPILDGNVARVLCRLEKIQADPRHPVTIKQLWTLAENILPPKNCGDFNSAMMELGATVCTPREPRCLTCPLKNYCKAFAAGLQDSIPTPKKSRPTPIHTRWTFCIRHNDHWLLERRPPTGRWASLWQFPTVEAAGPSPEAKAISRAIGLTITHLAPLGHVRHALTHRRYTFTAYTAKARLTRTAANRKWITLEELDQFPLSRPQLKIAELIRTAHMAKE